MAVLPLNNGNGGVKTKITKQEKNMLYKYMKYNQKSGWLDKNRPIEALNFLYSLIQGSWWQVFLILWTFLNLFYNILVIQKEKKLKKNFLLISGCKFLKSYDAFFDHFLPEPLGYQNYLFRKKKNFTKFVFTLFIKS